MKSAAIRSVLVDTVFVPRLPALKGQDPTAQGAALGTRATPAVFQGPTGRHRGVGIAWSHGPWALPRDSNPRPQGWRPGLSSSPPSGQPHVGRAATERDPTIRGTMSSMFLSPAQRECKALAISPLPCIMLPMENPVENPVQNVTSFLESLRLGSLWSDNGLTAWATLLVAIFVGLTAGRVTAWLLARIAQRCEARGWVGRAAVVSALVGPATLAILTIGLTLGLVGLRMDEEVLQPFVFQNPAAALHDCRLLVRLQPGQRDRLFGSITILLDRSFRIGDYVISGKQEGTIEDIGFRSTKTTSSVGPWCCLKTFKRAISE